MSILVTLLSLWLVAPPTHVTGEDHSEPPPSALPWSFPPVDLSPGQTLPNFALPTTKSEEPVFIHDLIAGRKTVLHVFASW